MALNDALNSINSKAQEYGYTSNQSLLSSEGISIDTSNKLTAAVNSALGEQSPTLKAFMKKVQTWWELVELLYKSSGEVKKTTLKNSKLVADSSYGAANKEQMKLDAQVYIKSEFDKFGHSIATGMTCPVCGKKIKYLYPTGYCSGECFLKDMSKKVASFLLSPDDKYKDLEEYINTIAAILDQITLIMNAIMGIPDILTEMIDIPQKYKDYVNAKINEGFCMLQVKINELMIKKNKLITKILRGAQFGVIMEPIAAVFSAIKVVEEGIKVAKDSFEEAYAIVINALKGLKVSGMCIPAEGMATTCTPRSYLSPMPYTSPDATKIFVNLPGGSGMQDLSLVKPFYPSAVGTTDVTSINGLISAAFPPIQTAEYYMPPEAFAVRYQLSQDSKVVPSVTQMLQDYMSAGPDYMPKFENMLPVKNQNIFGVDVPLPNIAYLWFLMGLADGWAMHSQALVGSFLHPEV